MIIKEHNKSVAGGVAAFLEESIVRREVCHLPRSHHISISPHISPYLPIYPQISPHLPISPHISP